MNEEKWNTLTEITVNECLHYALGAENYGETIRRLLSYIGNRFHSDRVYIFELNSNDTVSNTYEWCAEGVTPQKDCLQNEPIATVECWLDFFKKDMMVIIEDVESVKNTTPIVYAALKPQDIHSLAACPLRMGSELIGFLGVDNPEKGQMDIISSFFRVIEHFVISFLKRRSLSQRLEHISYHDQLTDALNRRAFMEKEKELNKITSAGVLYGDITGLKMVNDQLGHNEGDKLICRCYEQIRRVFEQDYIYRMGGDEFLVLCENISQEEFEKKCRHLIENNRNSDCNIAIGFSWGNPSTGFEVMVQKAEEGMYHSKREYYSSVDTVTGECRDRRRQNRSLDNLVTKCDTNARNIYEYLVQNPDCIELLINSISSSDSNVGLCVGDLRSNLFYISDNLKEIFNFSGNVVNDLLKKWEKLICYDEDRELFRQDMRGMRDHTKEKHDLKYRVFDKEGSMFWVHSTGIFHWNKEHTVPLYFIAGVSRQEFVIDPVTSLPRENTAVKRLKDIKKDGQKCVVLGIGLNHFSAINEIKGRDAADHLLQDINASWSRKLSKKMRFYRLDGVRFMVIVNPECTEPVDDIVKDIRRIVQSSCKKLNVAVKNPCCVCVVNYPTDIADEENLIEKVVSGIEISKSYIEKDYINYSALNDDTQKLLAEYMLNLNQDVLNHFQNFRVVVQPIMSAGNDKIEGGEVLMRWKYKGKEVPPAVFMPLLEKNGLICQAGRWVFEETVRNCRRIVIHNPDFQLSFNFSYLQIADEGFLSFMKATLKKYGVNGSNLIMELTENHFDDEPEKLMQLIDGCKKLGISIALDDFGSGYSSLGLLLKYPTNIVKLDRSLVCEMVDSLERQKFLQAIIYACHQFGKRVCVEGVEILDSVQIVKETGCDMIQGFYYYPPLELFEFYEVMSRE